ncbi:MAG: hypothetical protein GX786_05150, partial [Clostridiales bacterium]|nr:hypothetical protein [Clostridiales bacterium]
QVGLMGLGYILARAGGKFLGAWLGAKVVNAHDSVRKYLGLALLPQGGISIGLSVIVRQQLPPEYSVPIITIIMFSVLVYETTGPIFAKIAIKRAGEIGGMDKREEEEVSAHSLQSQEEQIAEFQKEEFQNEELQKEKSKTGKEA